MDRLATIRDELASVPSIAGFNLDRAAKRIASHQDVTDRVESILSQIDALGGHSLAALFDQMARDLRKHFDDDTADLANALADAIRAELRSEDRAIHGGVA